MTFGHIQPLNSAAKTEGRIVKTFIFGQKFWPLVYHCSLLLLYYDFFLQFLISQAKTFNMRYTRYPYKNSTQRYSWKCWKIAFHRFLKLAKWVKLINPWKVIFQHYKKFLLIKLLCGHLKSVWKRMSLYIWPFYDHFWLFFAICMFIFHKTEVLTVILRCTVRKIVLKL